MPPASNAVTWRARSHVWARFDTADEWLEPDDRYTVPLCSKHHAEQTRIGEYAFWHLGPDPLLVALALYSVSGDNEAGEKICEAAFRSWPSEPTERLGKHRQQ